MDRTEHLERCKKRAFKYLDMNDIEGAWGSMCSDLSKHPETENHIAINLGMTLFMTGNLNTIPAMRNFIDGFN